MVVPDICGPSRRPIGLDSHSITIIVIQRQPVPESTSCLLLLPGQGVVLFHGCMAVISFFSDRYLVGTGGMVGSNCGWAAVLVPAHTAE